MAGPSAPARGQRAAAVSSASRAPAAHSMSGLATTSHSPVALHRIGGNVGYGRAANYGASGATGEWLVVANPDIEWAAGALDTLLTAAERWPRAGALGPAIRTPEGALYPSARAFPSLARGLGHAAFGWWWPANPWTAAYRRT